MKQLNWYQIFGQTHTIPDGRTVTPTDDIQIWLNCANIWDKTYTTLAEVLADNDTLLALITSDNAVDYMVRSTTWAVPITVPVMTSNTTPSGRCGSTVSSIESTAYRAFDGNDTTSATSSGGISPTMVYYDFGFAVPIGKIRCYHTYGTAPTTWSGKVQYSDDGITFSDATSSLTLQNNTEQFFSFTPSSHRYWAFSLTTNPAKTGMGDYQFYSTSVTDNLTAMSYIGLNNYCANTLLADSTWCEAICNSEYFESVLNVKVPTMTSNTAPSGECISSGANNSSEDNYKAFDNDPNTLFASSGSTTSSGLWLGYTFATATKIICAKAVHRANITTAVTMNFQYQAKSSSGNWRDISDSFDVSFNNNMPTTTNVISGESNDVSYRIYRNSATVSTRLGMWTLQFYGREDV